jgi:hypothetical protein
MPLASMTSSATGGYTRPKDTGRVSERSEPAYSAPSQPAAFVDEAPVAPVDDEPPTPPEIRIAAPAADRLVTADAVFTVAGIARDRVGIVGVTWSTDSGSSGVATGLERWSIRDLKVPVGTTVVTVTARNALGDLASDSLTIVRQAPAITTLAIESPTAEPAWKTTASTVALRGVASDNVVRVTWAADWGGTGTATGTRQWTIPTIGLQIGANRITVRAHDATGAVAERIVFVTYSPRASPRR